MTTTPILSGPARLSFMPRSNRRVALYSVRFAALPPEGGERLGLLIRWTQVRILPGALIRGVCPNLF